MLEVGNEGMTFTEQVAHMTMWAINKVCSTLNTSAIRSVDSGAHRHPPVAAHPRKRRPEHDR